MPIRNNPNSDNFINYTNKKYAATLRCPTCGEFYRADTFVKGVCAYCDRDFKRIKEKNAL